MPDTVRGGLAGEGSGNRDRRMHAIAAALTAQGLQAEVHVTRSVLDITATLRRRGHKDIDVVLDDDGYTELRYWADDDAGPEQVAAVIAQALTAITQPARSGRPPPA